MNRRTFLPLLFLIGATFLDPATAYAQTKVYGEWLIRPKPAKGAEYNKLIEQKGLPLFREAGGRMVGWWNTLIGNLYEHVTIWEYDDMAAFQKAVTHLSKSEPFKEFVALRDPLLAGEDSRFLKLASFAQQPPLGVSDPFVIHEIHRVPLKQQENYLDFMEKIGLPLLKKHGFRPVGPWVTAVGKWSEITYLFRFEHLAERDRLIREFSAHPDGKTYGQGMVMIEEITTRLLLPAPFAVPPKKKQRSSSLLPHVEEMAPGVFAAGFMDRYRTANCGWVALANETLLVDLPHGVPIPGFLKEVAGAAGKPVGQLVLTNVQPGDAATVATLLDNGVKQVLTSPVLRDALLGANKNIKPGRIKALGSPTAIGDEAVSVELLPADEVMSKGGAVVYLPGKQVLFAGPLVVNGPRARLPGTDTGLWLTRLRELEKRHPAHIVPGRGSWGTATVLTRQRRFLAELRRQVGYIIAQGRTLAEAKKEVRLPEEFHVWWFYDFPDAEDIEHVYRELTVPLAPFHGRVAKSDTTKPHALVLIGDMYHEPGHLEEGLRPVFAATGVVPHFAVDVRALSAENLAKVQLLVILRDGWIHPEGKPRTVWMQPEQERAVVQFVEGGGAFLNLHNSMGLYPEDGPYLKLAAGKFTGHGPLERFRVEVVDAHHPVTRGVHDYSVADEQHTPIPDTSKVRLLLRNRSDDGKTVAAAGWVYEPGRGRLCHLANGHTREALFHPMCQRLMRNAVNWCLRRE